MNEIDVDELADKIATRLADRLDDRRLLRMNEAAERLSVSRRTLYSMLERDELAAITVAGGSMRIEQREIDRYIADRRSSDD